ncbi:hypothetical protein ECDEC8B_3811 [Escherichia coli DEC8B]|nr:hypothetical protein ECDEC8B_3811 [Escherichia coli DEC8B]
MWPEESSYFNRGVVEGILTKNHNARLSGYIFVDFSVSFLRLFLEKDWIDYLASTDMGIVLVSDRNMQSLANYWRKHNSAISAVIYNDDGLDVANEKIRQLFIGRYLSFTRGNTLTQMEFTIMGIWFLVIIHIRLLKFWIWISVASTRTSNESKREWVVK